MPSSGGRAPAAASAGAAVALVAMAPGHGGAYTALALPATGARQLLVPAALALALGALRHASAGALATAAAASFVLAVVHPTYAIFLWIPFGGFLAVQWAWRREPVRDGALAYAALVIPAGLFLVWLIPVVRSTASVSPDADERARAFQHYAGQLHGSTDSFSLAPEIFGRSGAIAVAALLLIPLTALASKRRWAAFVVGGSLAVFAITLVPALFTAFSDLVSLSQSRRLAGFVPFAFAFAGGMEVLAGAPRPAGGAVRPRRRAGAAVAVPGRLRLHARDRRPRVGDVGRGRRCARCGRPGDLAAAVRRGERGGRVVAAPAADLRPRTGGVVAVGRAEAEPADARPRRRAPGRRSRPVRSSTRTWNRATASPPTRPSTCATHPPVMSPTRSGTARISAARRRSGSSARASSGSHAAAEPAGSSSTATAST